MNTLFNNKPISVQFASSLFSGYGHQRIKVELEYEGETEIFSATTDFMPGFDKANELEGQERYDALYDLIEAQIEEEVLEWLTSIASNN